METSLKFSFTKDLTKKTLRIWSQHCHALGFLEERRENSEIMSLIKKIQKKIDDIIERSPVVRKRKDDDYCRVLFSVCNN
jgi:hypothetical protein